MSKKFNQDTFDRTDRKARDLVKDFAIRTGCDYVVDNPDVYGADLIASYKGREFFIEVEIRESWKTGKLPFRTVRLPIRKEKFIDDSIRFCMLNASCTDMLVIDPSEYTTELARVYVDGEHVDETFMVFKKENVKEYKL